ncbi:MAG: hypothetical protein RIS80_751, partial [Actinomycetota bacterium]
GWLRKRLEALESQAFEIQASRTY